ncbi:MAG: DoxX family protein [Marinilabiliales bacterium]|nr:DoxX family protein [Marinilabiliales bacterium]
MNPDWTARGYLEGSRWIFGDLFRWMASGDTGIQIINSANEWGLTLIGLALILGVFTRLASWAGVAMLAMYYLAYPPFGGFNYGAASEGSYLFVNKNLMGINLPLVSGIYQIRQVSSELDQLLIKQKKQNPHRK